jgi:hypothetical protein
MLAALVAALALAGAPASTPVICNPDLPSVELGQTHWDAGGSPSIQLSGPACAAMLLLSASPNERKEIAALNPDRNISFLEGWAAVALHEASHVALNSTDETTVQCRAMALLPQLLAKFLSTDETQAVLSEAKAQDAQLPAPYHARPC